MCSIDGSDGAAAAHEVACVAGEPMYRDPSTGAWTMTERYLRERGSCCGEGCRHCPYAGTAAEHPSRAHNLGRKPRGSQ
ncbi:MAG: hypothetical protein FJ100_19570 [Deltaproteobacteria bacterium]|nr:hypothetical protein [Deltaproteobacteria bacterium]